MAAQQTFAFFSTETDQRRELKKEFAKRPAPVPSPSVIAKSVRVATRTAPTGPTTTATLDRHAVLAQLRQNIGRVDHARAEEAAMMSSGCQELDRCLPRGGLRTNAIHEWVAASNSSGASALAMIALAGYLKSSSGASRLATGPLTNGPLVVVDREGTFYPPAAVAVGIPAKRMVVVRPPDFASQVWAIDQALRCESVAAVWSHVGQSLNDRDARRFQLAAESGQTPGFLIRPASVRGCPTFADVRMYVEPARLRPAAGEPFLRLQVTMDRVRGGVAGQKLLLQVDPHGQLQSVDLAAKSQIRSTGQTHHHETAAMHLASRLAHPAAAQSRADTRRRRA